jgi:hypothetical protein
VCPVEEASGVIGDEEPHATARAEDNRGELLSGGRCRGGQIVA